jgi:hypothetical protein
MNRSRFAIIALALAIGVGIFRVPILQAVTASYNSTVRIVDSAGNVINGVASAVTANYNSTVRVVDSTGHVIDSFGGGSGPTSGVAVTLSSAQIKALDLTPITLVAAQGANKVIIPTAILIQGKFGTRAYTSASNPSIDFFYNTRAAANLLVSYTDDASNPAKALFTAAASASAWNGTLGASNAGWAPVTPYAGASAPTLFANQPLLAELPANGSPYNSGPILTMTVANGGAGYANGDTFTIDAGQSLFDTGDATGHVLTSSGGVVQTVAINTAGTSYAVTTANTGSGPYPTAHTSGSGNDALTVNVATATVGDGTGSITVFYNVATLQ